MVASIAGIQSPFKLINVECICAEVVLPEINTFGITTCELCVSLEGDFFPRRLDASSIARHKAVAYLCYS
jgi:hypothetical protein